MKSLFEMPIHLTGKVLDMRLMRQNVVMSNLANLSTPNYKARRLTFEEDLQSALNLDARGKMSRTSMDQMPSFFSNDNFGPNIEQIAKHRVIHGEDNVDLDKEMAIMSKNTLMYNALTTVLKKNFEGLQTTIAEASK